MQTDKTIFYTLVKICSVHEADKLSTLLDGTENYLHSYYNLPDTDLSKWFTHWTTSEMDLQPKELDYQMDYVSDSNSKSSQSNYELNSCEESEQSDML